MNNHYGDIYKFNFHININITIIFLFIIKTYDIIFCSLNSFKYRKLNLHENKFESLPESFGSFKKITYGFDSDFYKNKLSWLSASFGELKWSY